MSFIRFAIRVSAVEAIRGKTLVGENVLDSEIGALDVAADGSLRIGTDKPFVSVYSDNSQWKEGMQLRSLASPGELDLFFEAGIATAHAVTDAETDESVVLGMPATDASFEFFLDVVMRQIADALDDPENEWAAIFRELCISFRRVERARVTGDTNGVRLAAHQLKIVTETTFEPIRGRPLVATSPIAKFLAKCEADLVPTQPDIAGKIALMRAQIEGDEDDLQTAIRRYGLVFTEADAMLITPFEAAP